MVRKWGKGRIALSSLIIPKCGKFTDLHLSDDEEGGEGGRGSERPFIGGNTPMSSPIRSPTGFFCKSPLSAVMKSPARSPTSAMSPRSSNDRQPVTPRGYLAMYVGERDAEKKRFLVKTHVLNHPLFDVLLNKAKEEFGFEQQGPLTIPCDVAFFQHILFLVQSDNPSYRNAEFAASMVQGKF